MAVACLESQIKNDLSNEMAVFFLFYSDSVRCVCRFFALLAYDGDDNGLFVCHNNFSMSFSVFCLNYKPMCTHIMVCIMGELCVLITQPTHHCEMKHTHLLLVSAAEKWVLIVRTNYKKRNFIRNKKSTQTQCVRPVYLFVFLLFNSSANYILNLINESAFASPNFHHARLRKHATQFIHWQVALRWRTVKIVGCFFCYGVFSSQLSLSRALARPAQIGRFCYAWKFCWGVSKKRNTVTDYTSHHNELFLL